MGANGRSGKSCVSIFVGRSHSTNRLVHIARAAESLSSLPWQAMNYGSKKFQKSVPIDRSNVFVCYALVNSTLRYKNEAVDL